MKRKKHTKHGLTEEDKQIIRRMKSELSSIGIPREQWSAYIQQELQLRKGSHASRRFSKNNGELHGILGTFRGKINNLFQRFLKKRLLKMGQNEESFEDMLDLFNSSRDGSPYDESNIMNSLFPSTNLKPPNNLDKHGTFITERSDKKSMIINFDDDED